MAERLNPERPAKLSIVVFSGKFDKVHYALVMASAAAAIDTPVTLLFTMEGIKSILKPEADGAGSWGAQSTSTCLETGADMDARFQDLGLADFETLLSACLEMGVRIMVCEMGLKAMEIDAHELRDDIKIENGGMVTFLNDANKGGSVLFI